MPSNGINMGTYKDGILAEYARHVSSASDGSIVINYREKIHGHLVTFPLAKVTAERCEREFYLFTLMTPNRA